MHEEEQYLSLISDILLKGSSEIGRNGPVKFCFGRMMRFSLKDGTLPILTTKTVFWRTCFHELKWFLSGKTDNRLLKEKNVKIWNGNGTRDFLDSRGLYENREDDLGPIYGHQWRHFNAPYDTCETDYTGKGIDQIANVIQEIKTNPTSRRLIVCAWNPCQLNEMALPPCHVMMQFSVREGKYLSCLLTQRSGDVGLGVPFNITSYSLLTHLIAHFCGLEAEEFVYSLGNAHIYESHIEPLTEQVLRIPKPFPKIEIVPKQAIHDISDYDIEDIEWITPYDHHPTIRMDMIA